jgi:hypothetical protein
MPFRDIHDKPSQLASYIPTWTSNLTLQLQQHNLPRLAHTIIQGPPIP